MSAEALKASRFLTLLPFEVDHLALIEGGNPLVADPAVWHGMTPGGAVTLVSEAGVLGCGGLVVMDKDHAEAWAVLSPIIRERPIVLHRMVLRGLRNARFRRIGATVQRGFCAGEQWLERLGFRQVDRDQAQSAVRWTGDYLRYEKCQSWHC